MAEYHYRKAAEIHPNNAVLLGCVGMVRKSLSARLTIRVWR
jgi:anaphase-promoting complex subunit 3